MREWRTTLTTMVGVVARGVGWGGAFGVPGGCLVGSVISVLAGGGSFRSVGSSFGAIIGFPAGMLIGLICGVVLAGYFGIRRGWLGHDPVAVAGTFPVVAVMSVVGIAAVVARVDADIEVRVLDAVTTPVAVVAGWFAGRNVGRWYLTAQGYPVEQVKGALRLDRPRPVRCVRRLTRRVLGVRPRSCRRVHRLAAGDGH